MENLKTYENFGEDELAKEVSHTEYIDWMKRHILIKDFDYIFDLFDSRFNLYQDEFNLYQGEPDENNYNTYKINGKSLKIRLNKFKQDLYINSWEDEWFTITQGFFINFDDEAYEEVKYFICDSIEGVEEFIKNHITFSGQP